jgi:hypothetical protein
MKKISRFLVVVAAVVSTPLFAQQGANTALTGVEGVPWGASREQVEATLGRPDSLYARGDKVNLIYWNRSAFGQKVMMDVAIEPAAGMTSAAYLVQRLPAADCVTTFDAVVAKIMDAHPGLRAEPRELLVDGAASTNPAADCRKFAAPGGPAVMVSRTLRDPAGPGSVFLFSAGQSSRGMMLAIQLMAETRSRR